MKKGLYAFGSCAGIAALAVLMGGTPETGRSPLWVLVLVMACFAATRFSAEKDRRRKACFGVLGAAVMLCTALSLRLTAAGRTGWDGLGLSLASAVCLGPAAGQMFSWLFDGLAGCRKPLEFTRRKAFWIAFPAMVLCWLPVFLAFFPGITGYDIDGQAWQIYTGNYSTHHPLLHTLFIELFMDLGSRLFGSHSLGYGLHTAVQLLLLAAAVAYAMRWLAGRGCSRALWWGMIAFFAVSPQHMLMASTGTKDVLFAAVLLVAVVELYRFVTEKDRCFDKRAWAVNVLLMTLACLLRNNMVYGLALLLMVCVVLWRKQLGVRVLSVLLAAMIAASAGLWGLKTLTGAAEGSVREKLCLPIQQLSRVFSLYGYDVPVGYEIAEFIPNAKYYTPERADITKQFSQVENEQDRWSVIKIWIREAFHFPIEYIDAFLLNVRAYWDPMDVSFATTYDSPPDELRGCMIVWHNPNSQIDMQDFWPEVKAACEKLFAENQIQRFPVLWMLIHPAPYTWLLCFLAAAAIYRRHKGLLLACGVLACYLLTLLLGPCALIRYSYYLMLALPILLGAFFIDVTAKEEYHV